MSFKKRQKSHLNDILSCQVQQPGYGDHGKNNEKDLKLGSVQAIDHKTFFTCKVFRLLVFHELSDTIMFASIHGEEKAESK